MHCLHTECLIFLLLYLKNFTFSLNDYFQHHWKDVSRYLFVNKNYFHWLTAVQPTRRQQEVLGPTNPIMVTKQYG